jgi:hypothetical protein
MNTPRLAVALRGLVPAFAARAVDERLVEALASLARHALPAASRPRTKASSVPSASSISSGQGRWWQRAIERAIARQRLFEVQQRIGPRGVCRQRSQPREQLGERRRVAVLLIAVERVAVAGRVSVEHRQHLAEALHVGPRIAAELDLEHPVPVARDHRRQAHRQRAGLCGQRLQCIEQADGVAGLDAQPRWHQRREPAVPVEAAPGRAAARWAAGRSRCARPASNTDTPSAWHSASSTARSTSARRRRSTARSPRRGGRRRPGGRMALEQLERTGRHIAGIGLHRALDGVGRCSTFCACEKPARLSNHFGHHQFGRMALPAAAAGHLDGGAHEELRAAVRA